MTPIPQSDLDSQVERLVTSPLLQGSESLRKLLRYLAAQAVRQPGVPIREYQIATEVFGRSPEFDSRTDAIVRVQTGRLRTKLADYYRSLGENDPLIVEIPKGSYLLIARHRPVEAVASDPQPEPAPLPVMPAELPVAEPAPRPRNWPAWIFGALSLLLAVAVAYLLWDRAHPCQ